MRKIVPLVLIGFGVLIGNESIANESGRYGGKGIIASGSGRLQGHLTSDSLQQEKRFFEDLYGLDRNGVPLDRRPQVRSDGLILNDEKHFIRQYPGKTGRRTPNPNVWLCKPEGK